MIQNIYEKILFRKNGLSIHKSIDKLCMHFIIIFYAFQVIFYYSINKFFQVGWISYFSTFFYSLSSNSPSSSTSGLYGTPQLATYCMSKWGILGLTKTLAKEVGSKGIIVNALCPTKVKTPMCETMDYVKFINDLTGEDFKSVEEMYAGVPFLEVEDIASMVYWLGTSREAGKFNGQGVPLDLGTLQ